MALLRSLRLPTVLATHAVCRSDPTVRSGPGHWWRATYTPEGPGTIGLRWRTDSTSLDDLDVTVHGPGAPWLLERVPALVGALDPPDRALVRDPATALPRARATVRAAVRDVGPVVFGRTETPYHDLLPIILAQRITAREAARQWTRLCHALGEPAPGSIPGLRLPPHPTTLVGRPAWWFHPLGIEARRADALVTVARHASRIGQLDPDHPSAARAWLLQLPGIGPWTVANVAQRSFGDPDAVVTGDYWLPHLVVHALAGRARGTDEEMLELLEPWASERARVVRLLSAAGHRVVRFAAGQRVLPMERW